MLTALFTISCAGHITGVMNTHVAHSQTNFVEPYIQNPKKEKHTKYSFNITIPEGWKFVTKNQILNKDANIQGMQLLMVAKSPNLIGTKHVDVVVMATQFDDSYNIKNFGDELATGLTMQGLDIIQIDDITVDGFSGTHVTFIDNPYVFSQVNIGTLDYGIVVGCRGDVREMGNVVDGCNDILNTFQVKNHP